ncbi:SOUL family heme-binding protein [Haloferax namakaokahaiae]|uniref:SOUL family heme-binding protein n=1 Tax=Haloferax namakaokahaiae TaxID=1748331 RepID=A0ABD5ZER4_9EURY
MKRRTVLALSAVGLAVAGILVTRTFGSDDVEQVPYTVVEEFRGVELRHYPTTVTVETSARNSNAAFRRLFNYLSGANRTRQKVSMTAPVQTDQSSAKIPMTAPVATEPGDEGMQMAFFLPAEYDYESAPRPTDPAVELAEHPARTLAVRQFSWLATDRRTKSQTDALVATLAEESVPIVGEPFLLQYDSPWTLPFLRTNEVAVEVQRRTAGRPGN